MPVKPKIAVSERLLPGFAHFMADVAKAIDDGDESAWMESDDLLQCEDFRGYGGLFDAAEGRYGFEYLADDCEEERERDDPICWDFHLNRQEIREIANGTISLLDMCSLLDMWRCEPDCGRRFPKSDYYCPVCDAPE